MAANRRSADDFRRAKRHSVLVKALKIALPAAVALVIAGFITFTVVSFVPLNGLSIGSTSLKDGKLVMEDPKMAGYDRNNRPFDVRASKATQDLRKTEIIELDTIEAQLPIDDTSFAEITAVRGTFDTQAETLQLHEKIEVLGARGMNIELQSANIDIKSGTMTSSEPVVVTSDRAVIEADTVRVEDNGKRVIFQNRVRTVISQPIARGQNAAESSEKSSGTDKSRDG